MEAIQEMNEIFRQEERTSKSFEGKNRNFWDEYVCNPTTPDLWDQDGVVSEILSFLDARSLLNMCKTTKRVALLLRYDHVFSSTQRVQYDRSQLKNQRVIESINSSIIVDKLSQVYGMNGKADKNDLASFSVETVTNRKLRTRTKPSPLRLLRLVNGKRCEHCHRSLSSPLVWIGCSTARMLLPSLTLGEFCCTPCIFNREHEIMSTNRTC